MIKESVLKKKWRVIKAFNVLFNHFKKKGAFTKLIEVNIIIKVNNFPIIIYWSNCLTQWSQIEQWEAKGGLIILHVVQYLS